ncbi:hypothetical protein HRG84_01050 [Flavisolibacter sp. BT320]|nr:hypothetical protein [Flavisolibacter longurius]
METKQQPIGEAMPSPSQESLFSNLADSKPYEKSLRTARIWLYVLTVLQIGLGVYEYSTLDPDLALFALLIDVGIGILFFGLALWSYKKPAASFLTALIVYVVIYIGAGILEPANLYKGVLLKIFIVFALVKAYKDAREVEKWKESIGTV